MIEVRGSASRIGGSFGNGHGPESRMSRVIGSIIIVLIAGLCIPVKVAAQSPASPPSPEQIDALIERLQRLEVMNHRLIEQYDAVLDREAERDRRYQELEQRYQGLLDRLEIETTPPATPGPPPADDAVVPVTEPSRPMAELFDEPWEASPLVGPGRDRAMSPEADSVFGRAMPGPGRDYPTFEPSNAPPLIGRLGNGFELVTPDDELSLGVRVLNQVDFKAFAPNDLDPATSGLYLPRTRFYFTGRLTRPIEYEVSFQRGLEGTVELLDGFVNFRLDEAFQIKFGRSLVPYSFDWYDHLEPYFITPERSLYPMNFGLSRQAGLMAWGYLGDGSLEYAAGGFSGGMIGIADINTTQEAVGYLNWRPFLTTERFDRLRYLNLGGSIAGGATNRSDEERPMPLRTSIQATENSREANAASISFLDFEEDVRALGDRFQGALHMAYYGGGWSIESEVQAGQYQYAKLGMPGRATVPVLGYHVTAAKFLTGEVIDGRTTVVPLRPFEPLRGRFGPGAFEVYARISQLHLGREVFEFDLANEQFWTRDVTVTDVGFNWYSNRFVKFYFDWQRAAFGSPVLVNERNGHRSRESDLFWLRCQIWF